VINRQRGRVTTECVDWYVRFWVSLGVVHVVLGVVREYFVLLGCGALFEALRGALVAYMVSSRSSRKTNSYSVRRDGGGRRNRTVVDHIYETHIAPRFRLHERDLHQTELASREISRELLQMARDLIDRGISTVSTFDVPGTAPRLVLVRDVDEPDHSGRPVQYRPFGTNHQGRPPHPLRVRTAAILLTP